MARTLTIALAGFGLISQSLATDVWTKQSPFPTDRSLNGVFGFHQNRFYIVGSDRTLMETINGGATWTTLSQTAYSGEPYYAVSFVNNDVGLVIGNNSDAVRTVNSGSTWLPISTMPAGSNSHIDFLSSTQVFVGANGALNYSSDGGANWVNKSGWPNCPVIFGMDFVNTSVGLVCGVIAGSGQNGIFKTVNGGTSWTQVLQSYSNDVLWMTSTRAIADSGTEIVQSTDSGSTWFPIANGITSGVVCLARAGTSNVVLGVSGKGDVWRSPDGGFTWVQTFDGPGALPQKWAIQMASESVGWICGDIGLLYGTTDGGITWTQIGSGCGAQITDISMLNQQFGMAVGHNGYIFRTLNGGEFWDIQKLEVTGQIWGRDEDLVAIDVVDQQFAAAAGPGGTVFKTNDGGNTWTSIGYPNLPGHYWIYDVDFITPELGYVYGIDDIVDRNNLYRTTDGGLTWTVVDHGNVGGGTTLQFVDSQYGWITADNAVGQRTMDGGATWSWFYMPTYYTGPEVSKVEFLNRNLGWVVGWNGYVAKTTNGGTTWSMIDIGTIDEHFFDISIVSESEMWMVGRMDLPGHGLVYHTLDGGQSWSRQVVQQFPVNPFTITALPTGDAWYAGFGGTIYHRSAPAQIVNPSRYRVLAGQLTSGGLASLLQSDNAYLQLAASSRSDFGKESISIQLDGTCPLATPSTLNLSLESHTTVPGIEFKVEFWNYSTSQWEQIGTFVSTSTDSTITAEASGSAARYVASGSRNVIAKISWNAPLHVKQSKNVLSIDRANWSVAP